MKSLLPGLFVALFSASMFLHPAAADSTKAVQWERWEHSLTSARAYKNPCRDVVLSVTYTGPDGRELKACGFWDGDAVFKIRCAFPVAGQWTWKTASSDPANGGLDHQEGMVIVSPYAGSNPLFRHGMLKVDADKHHLDFADGTPFFWAGDTAWIAPMSATTADWKSYIDNRVENKFSVIQIASSAKWSDMEITMKNGDPFQDGDITRLNPGYWRAFDEKVAYANSRGLYILVVGIMEPLDRYPSGADAAIFARNLVAHLHGSFVIFSPSFDSSEKVAPLGNAVGKAIREATSLHLITQHGGTGLVVADVYHDQTYVDFASYQSGHHRGDKAECADAAASWALELYRRNPTKPVVNVEAFYDAGDFPTKELTYSGNAKDARSLGYLSRLSGAAGYTYGAYGIWNWVTDSKSPAFWTRAMHYSSATEMKWQSEFFSTIEWWRLVPAPEFIKHQPYDPLKHVAFAKSGDGSLAVAYLPGNPSVEIDTRDLSPSMSGRWYDPVTGKYTPVSNPVSTGGIVTFTPPKTGDWVLLLKK